MWDLTIYQVVDLHQDTEILWDGPLVSLVFLVHLEHHPGYQAY